MTDTIDLRTEINRAVSRVYELASTRPTMLSGRCVCIESFVSGAESLGESLLNQPLVHNYRSFRMTSEWPALSFADEYLHSRGLKVAIVPFSMQVADVEPELRQAFLEYFAQFLQWRRDKESGGDSQGSAKS